MKKSIFKAYWLVALTICMLASCTSQKEEIETNNTTPNEIVTRKNVRSRSTLPPVSNLYDLPAYIGALHNAGIYAFVEYVNENNLSPYTECDFTDEMIETFAQNYVIEHLCDFEYLCDFDIELDTNILSAYGILLDSILSCDMEVADINNCIDEATADFYAEYAIVSPDDIIYEVVKEITKATNTLWGEEWDFEQQSFIFPYSTFAGRSIETGDASGENTNDPEREEEDSEEEKKKDQQELKKADLGGAIMGGIKGAKIGVNAGIATGGGAVITGAWGALIGAAVGAVGASILEHVTQEIVEEAKIIEPENVYQNTYLYDYLLRLQHINPTKYQELFGGKFDGFIY